jgi:predicted nucleic acid-binding protein
MRAYADSSFLVKLVSSESDREKAIGEYRRVGNPALFFLPLHELEVTSAILQRAYHQRHSIPSAERKEIARERDVALARVEKLKGRRFIEVELDGESAHQLAMELVLKRTEADGNRAIDILHVANALTLGSELFLTADQRQAQVAKAEGLEVIGL